MTKFNLSIRALRDALEAAKIAVSKDPMKPMLQHIAVRTVKRSIEVLAVDGHRLVIHKPKLTQRLEGGRAMALIEIQNVNELLKLLKRSDTGEAQCVIDTDAKRFEVFRADGDDLELIAGYPFGGQKKMVGYSETPKYPDIDGLLGNWDVYKGNSLSMLLYADSLLKFAKCVEINDGVIVFKRSWNPDDRIVELVSGEDSDNFQMSWKAEDALDADNEASYYRREFKLGISATYVKQYVALLPKDAIVRVEFLRDPNQGRNSQAGYGGFNLSVDGRDDRCVIMPVFIYGAFLDPLQPRPQAEPAMAAA